MGKEDEIGYLTLLEPTIKLYRWILAFKKIADIIVKANIISNLSGPRSKEKKRKQRKSTIGKEYDEADVSRLQFIQQQRRHKNKEKEEERNKEIENSLQKERERLRAVAKNLNEKSSGKHLRRKEKKQGVKKYPIIPKSILNR